MRGLWCAALLALACLGWAAPGEAADEQDETLAEPSWTVVECDCGSMPPCTPVEECNCTSPVPSESSVWDDYDPKEAGHPLRIAAYALHPVGVVIDYLIFRPAWWIGSYEPFHTLFGRTD
jgi:hypothetical protein